MIRTLFLAVMLSVSGVGLPASARAETYKLLTGETIEGTPIAPNAQGVVIKRPDGSLPSRTGWTNFTQEALKEFAKTPQIRRFIEPLLEEEIDEPEGRKSLEITIKTPPRVERPDSKAGLSALFSSGLSVFMLLLMYAGNIYAAFEVAIFKNRPPLLVCGIAAVAPVIGPVIFLCLPRPGVGTVEDIAEGEMVAEDAAHAVGATAEAAHGHAAGHHGHGHPGSPPAGTAPAAAQAPPQIYQRGQFTFNRRFFETKLAGFLRMVPSEAEKDMVLHVKSSRGEHAATRIARITPNDVAFQVTKGGASAEVIIPFNEINEVRVQHREA
jgi:hypothetical protein